MTCSSKCKEYVCITGLTLLLIPVLILGLLIFAAWITMGVSVYLLDVGTDINTTYHHYANGNVWWGTMTLIFTLNPVLITWIVSTYSVTQCHSGDTIRSKCLLATVGIFASPFLHLILMMKAVVASINDSSSPFLHLILMMKAVFASINDSFFAQYIASFCRTFFIYTGPLQLPTIPYIDTLLMAFTSIMGHGHDDAAVNAGVMKLLQALLQSLPQVGLQLFIMAQTWKGVAAVESWQWATVSVSLLSLIFGIYTNSYVFKHSSIISRAVLLLLGLMAVTSRIMICVLYSMAMKYLFLLPIGSWLAVTIIMSVRMRLNTCRGSDIWGIVIIGLTWLLTSTCNCFTMTGLRASTLNVAFAMGVWFLPVPSMTQPLAFAVSMLAFVSFVINVILLVVPSFIHTFGDHWMSIHTLTLSSEEIQSKEFMLKYSCVKDVYVRPTKSGDHKLKGWRAGVYEAINVCRYEENGVVFLRTKQEGASSVWRRIGTDTVRWRVNWSGSNLTPRNVTVSLHHKGAGLTWYIVVGSSKFGGGADEYLELKDLALGSWPVRHLDVVVNLEGGSIAQLFRQQEIDTINFPFVINIIFGDEYLPI